MRPHFSPLAAAFALLLGAPFAHAQSTAADHVYIVGAGDTLSRIAAHLEVAPSALAARNYLRAPYALRVGRRLRLPDGVPPEVWRHLPSRNQPASPSDSDSDSDSGSSSAPHRPGFATLVRRRDGAVISTNLTIGSQSQRVRMERFFRFRDGSRHGMHPRLLRALAALSDHFDGRRILVFSGFRPQLHHEAGPRTRHSQGYAVDVRVEGASLAAVHAFCEGLDDMGCGIYPTGGFVHFDVRRESASWRDTSGPGSHTRPHGDQDETVGEVLADAAPVRRGEGGNDSEQ